MCACVRVCMSVCVCVLVKHIGTYVYMHPHMYTHTLIHTQATVHTCYFSLLALSVCQDISMQKKTWDDLFVPLEFFTIYR